MLQAAYTEAHSHKMSYKTWTTVLHQQTIFSIVLQGVANSESRFTFKDTADYGKQSDSGTFSVSTLYHLK